MITKRPASERGKTDIGWLESYHSFSFGDYHDPDNREFSVLRVINDDIIGAGGGFPTHPHRDMEIITVPLEGSIAHRDSMGNGSVIGPGDVQKMTAGSGITHSEFNPSQTESTHLLQIWIRPESKGLDPSYEERSFDIPGTAGTPVLLVSPDGADGSITIQQDARLYGLALENEQTSKLELEPGRRGWIQVTRGHGKVGDHNVAPGDAVTLEGESGVEFSAEASLELLFFDLP